MSTQTTTRSDELGAFADIIANTSTTHGPDASRKAMLSDCAASLHVLASHGVEIPHREFLDDAEDAIEVTHSRELPDGDRIHLHQDVREVEDDDAFGDFGNTTDEDDDVIWTIVGLDDDIELTVVGDWSKRRHVPVEEFSAEYEPLWLADGQPQWGY